VATTDEVIEAWRSLGALPATASSTAEAAG
jgi:hypothetical protein